MSCGSKPSIWYWEIGIIQSHSIKNVGFKVVRRKNQDRNWPFKIWNCFQTQTCQTFILLEIVCFKPKIVLVSTNVIWKNKISGGWLSDSMKEEVCCNFLNEICNSGRSSKKLSHTPPAVTNSFCLPEKPTPSTIFFDFPLLRCEKEIKWTSTTTN